MLFRSETPAISSGIPAVNNAVNPVQGETFATNPAASVNPLYVWTFIVSVIWLIGIAAMLLYAVISYVRVRQSIGESVPYEGDIFLCDHVKSPFILGLVRPKIYLPSSMDAASMEPVIAHEKAHLTRCDHWWKPVGFLILTVLTRYVSLGSLWAGASFPFVSWYCYPNVRIVLLAFLLGGLVVWKHRGNAERLLHGTERKLSFHKKKEGGT